MIQTHTNRDNMLSISSIDSYLKSNNILTPEFRKFCLMLKDKINDLSIVEQEMNLTEVQKDIMTKLILLDGESIFMSFVRICSVISGYNYPVFLENLKDVTKLKFIPSVPSMINGSTTNGQCSACYLLRPKMSSTKNEECPNGMNEMSSTKNGMNESREYEVDNFKNVLTECSRIGELTSMDAGTGIDLTYSSITNIRKWLDLIEKILNILSGFRKRGASSTSFLSIYHSGIRDFLSVNNKTELDNHSFNVNTCVWSSWLFFDRVQKGGMFVFFSDMDILQQLHKSYGYSQKVLFEKYEDQIKSGSLDNSKFILIPARDLMSLIISYLQQSGKPFIMCRDSCLMKSNFRNYDISSNLCLEIIQPPPSICNLSSICLPKYCTRIPVSTIPDINLVMKNIDFLELSRVVRNVVCNVDRMIDRCYYPSEEIKQNNLMFRPMGIGVIGFFDMLLMLNVSISKLDLVRMLNRVIFSCIYYNCLISSTDLAKKYEKYSAFSSTLFSQGIIQPDLWTEERIEKDKCGYGYDSDICLDLVHPDFWGQDGSWDDLRLRISKEGIRNSALTCIMPTSNSSLIVDHSESTDGHQSIVYARTSGLVNRVIYNSYLRNDLEELGFNDKDIDYIFRMCSGSLQNLAEIVNTLGYALGFNINTPEIVNTLENTPEIVNTLEFDAVSKDFISPEMIQHLVDKYQTMWEIPQKTFYILAAERGIYIDHSQSLNLYLREPECNKLYSAIMNGYKMGLKTILYYLRTGNNQIPLSFSQNVQSIVQISTVCTEECENCQ